jgi:hypothetical protein
VEVGILVGSDVRRQGGLAQAGPVVEHDMCSRTADRWCAESSISRSIFFKLPYPMNSSSVFG